MASRNNSRHVGTVATAAALVLLSGCGGHHSPAAPAYSGSSTPAGHSADLNLAPPTASAVPIASPITAVPVVTPTDVQAAAASQFISPSSAVSAGTAAPATGVAVFTDPVAVARAYTTARWTFRSAERAGYTKALTAPGLSTPAFAARSVPTALALKQGATSMDVSTVSVTAAGISAEAPRTDVLASVTVAYTVTDSYAGSAGPRTAAHDWSLRITRAAPTVSWLVDGVQLNG